MNDSLWMCPRTRCKWGASGENKFSIRLEHIVDANEYGCQTSRHVVILQVAPRRNINLAREFG